MKFTQEIRNFILGYLSGDGPTPSGASCRFLQYEGVGIKFYGKQEENARKSFEGQSRAHGLGIAPAVGEYFKIQLRIEPYAEPINLFGYLTEIAADVGKEASIMEEKILCNSLRAAKFSDGDIMPRNCGRINGKLVCIDFDPVSMSC